MDEKDVAPSPDWGPARSVVSKGLQSSRTSSTNLSGPRSTNDTLTAKPFSNDRSDVVEIYPHETTRCAELIATIQSAQQLQSALQVILDTIQRHAKWFTPAGLEVLLQHALAKVSETTQTADLDVALELVDAVMKFSALPPTCLLPVVKFIALCYHSGTRMHKHKSLANKAWETFKHILDSHLGALSVAALLEVLDKEETQWARSSFSAVSGALRLLDDKFSFGGMVNTAHNVVMYELLNSLGNVVDNGDEMLKEQVIALLHKSVTSENTLTDLDLTGSWTQLISLVDHCAITSEDTMYHEFLDDVVRVSAHLEPRQLQALASVLIRANHGLPKEIADQVLEPTHVVIRLHKSLEADRHSDLLKTFANSSRHEKELQSIAKNDLDLLILGDEAKDWSYLVKTYLRLALNSNLPRESAVVCADFLCALLHSSFERSYLTASFWKIIMAWDAVTKVAVSAPRPEAQLCALRALSRMRVTINGYVYIEEDESSSEPTASGTMPGAVLLQDLPRKMWLEEILLLIGEPELEQNSMASSFVLASLPAQLGNLLFFVDQKDFIRQVHDISVHKLSSARDAVAANYVRILTALVNYRGLLSQSELRHMVDLFIKRAGSSEVISKDCIHALTLCCHEIPETVARDLDNVVQKMAQMITQKHLAIHVLEFLTGLSRLPELFRNFRTDDFRKIFGVCISYLQSLRDGQMSRQSNIGSDNGSSSHQAAHEVIPQYVYALAHHVMIFWYLVLRPDDRQLIKTYVSNSLSYKRDGDREVPDDQGLVVIDFMERVDSESKSHTGPRELTDGDLDDVFDEVDGKILTQHRICGLVLVSTHTSLRTAKTLVTTRRPSGTAKYLVLGRNPVTHEPWPATHLSMGPASLYSGSIEDETITIYSDDPDGASYGAIPVPSSNSPLGSAEVVTLQEDPALDRAIQIFDRTPGLDSHKAGVIYIGEGQTQEEDILANSSGSPDYRDIVENLGNLQVLKGAKFNTQGLDTRGDSDGEHVIVWNNEITELVFHITTMMPTDIKDKHMSAIRKKAHIGNDYVNIIFNNSGLPFRFDTFPSQFNYVYIVITPSVRTTFLQTRTHTVNTSDRNRFYRVEVLTRDEFPDISSAAEPKMISGASLPGYIRNLALNAAVFSEVWVNRDSDEYKSSWQTRLSQIRRLRDRHASGGRPVRAPSVASKGKGKATFWK